MTIREEVAQIEAAKQELRAELEALTRAVSVNWKEAPGRLVATTAERAAERLTLHHMLQPGYSPQNAMGLDRLSAFELLCLVDQKKLTSFLSLEGNDTIPADAVMIADEDRSATEARLKKELLDLDRQLVTLIDKAETAGLQVEIETLPHPLAVLGLTDTAEITWDFYSPRLEAMEAEAEAAGSIVQARRQYLAEARAELASLEDYAEDHRGGPPATLQREIAAAKEKLDRAQTAHHTALAEADRKRRLPGAVRSYLEANRRPKPVPRSREDMLRAGMITENRRKP